MRTVALAILLAVSSTAGDALPQSPTLLRVVAREYAFAAPTRARAGLVTVRLVNLGAEPHYLGLMRVDSGRTSADFLAWRSSRTARPAWLTPIGGAAPIVPNDSTDLVLPLVAGRYVLFCTYPSPDGTPHLMKGMVGDLTVDGPAVVAADATPVDLVITMKGTGFDLPGTFRAGRRTVRVRNDDPQMHQLLVIRLSEGVTAEQEMAWFRGGSRGPRPGRPTGGVLQLPPGETARFTANLDPGRYLLLCTVADASQRDPALRLWDGGRGERPLTATATAHRDTARPPHPIPTWASADSDRRPHPAAS